MNDVDDEDILGDLIAQGNPTKEVDDAVGGLLTEGDLEQADSQPDVDAESEREEVAKADDPVSTQAPAAEEARMRLAAQHEASRARAEQAASKAEQDAAAAGAEYQQAQVAWREARRKSLTNIDDDDDAAVDAEAKAQEALLEARDRRKDHLAYRDQAASKAKQLQEEPNLEMLSWFERNRRYDTDGAFKAEADKVATDLEHTQGLDPRKPQFWAKLDEGLNKGRRMIANGRTTPTPQPSSGKRGSGKKRDTASSNEATLMLSVGLDPKDPEHLAELRENYNRVKKVLAA